MTLRRTWLGCRTTVSIPPTPTGLGVTATARNGGGRFAVGRRDDDAVPLGATGGFPGARPCLCSAASGLTLVRARPRRRAVEERGPTPLLRPHLPRRLNNGEASRAHPPGRKRNDRPTTASKLGDSCCIAQLTHRPHRCPPTADHSILVIYK